MKSRFLIGVVVSLLLLVLLFWKIPLLDVARAFADASLLGLAVTVLIHALVLSLKVARWNIVLGSVPAPQPRPPWLVFDALFLGYFGNYALPAKLGEVGRSILYSRRSGTPFSAVFATSRIVGWMAHVAEQRRVGRILRPRARYVGERGPAGVGATA